jgi:proteasome lid subunit RPN8/RPN11
MRWAEAEPDLRIFPLADFLSGRSILDAVQFCAALNNGSVVIINKECRKFCISFVSQRSVEMGGLLLGHVYGVSAEGNGNHLIAVRAAIPSTHFSATGVSLRMEPQVWEEARQRADIEGLWVVGWFHSHPNLGAFFSGTDRETQKRFFSHSYSLGLVIDPVRNEERWFVGASSVEVPDQRIVCDPRSLEMGSSSVADVLV